MKTEISRKKRSSRKTKPRNERDRTASWARIPRPASPFSRADCPTSGDGTLSTLAALVMSADEKQHQVGSRRGTAGVAGLTLDVEHEVHRGIDLIRMLAEGLVSQCRFSIQPVTIQLFERRVRRSVSGRCNLTRAQSFARDVEGCEDSTVALGRR